MRRLKNNTSTKIADALRNLIELTKAANLGFTTQLLQMAHLDFLMNQHGIAAEELDALQAAFERQTKTNAVLNLEQIRELRRKRASHER